MMSALDQNLFQLRKAALKRVAKHYGFRCADSQLEAALAAADTLRGGIRWLVDQQPPEIALQYNVRRATAVLRKALSGGASRRPGRQA